MSRENILGQLTEIVGNQNVKEEAELYVVSPIKSEDIQSIVQLANKNGVEIHTKTCDDEFHNKNGLISKGILLDFSRMNKISNIDTLNRSVIIEPGVTFLQLQEELNKHNLRAIVPLGLPGTSSALNCYVERVPLLSAPKPLVANGWQCILTMDVVLPEGELLKTGAGGMESMKKPFYWPFGGGPDLSRTLSASQGTLGIVTRGTIKVKAIPQPRKLMIIPFEKIEDVIDKLYKLTRLEIGEECLLMNKFNLSLLLSEEGSDHKALMDILPQWMILLCLNGPEKRIQYQEEDLKDLGLGIMDLNSEFEKYAEEILDEFLYPKRISKILGYKQVCRKISFYTTIERLPEFNKKTIEIVEKSGYAIDELGAIITPIQLGRAAFIEYHVFGDDLDKAEKLYIDLHEMILNLGGNIDRPHGKVSEMIFSKSPSMQVLLKTVKEELDPNNIMNPNRLIIKSER